MVALKIRKCETKGYIAYEWDIYPGITFRCLYKDEPILKVLMFEVSPDFVRSGCHSYKENSNDDGHFQGNMSAFAVSYVPADWTLKMIICRVLFIEHVHSRVSLVDPFPSSWVLKDFGKRLWKFHLLCKYSGWKIFRLCPLLDHLYSAGYFVSLCVKISEDKGRKWFASVACTALVRVGNISMTN